MSPAAQEFAFMDAKADILWLAQEYNKMRDILRVIAYPCRNTEEEQATIQTVADLVISKWTLADLESPL